LFRLEGPPPPSFNSPPNTGFKPEIPLLFSTGLKGTLDPALGEEKTKNLIAPGSPGKGLLGLKRTGLELATIWKKLGPFVNLTPGVQIFYPPQGPHSLPQGPNLLEIPTLIQAQEK